MSPITTSEVERTAVPSYAAHECCGAPSEGARVASFLLGEDATDAVGRTILPDGGRLILDDAVPVEP